MTRKSYYNIDLIIYAVDILKSFHNIIH